MKHFRSKKLVLVLGISLISIAPANAAGWMEDYFNSAGAGMNITAPATYQTQGQNVISGGGFAWRVPQRNPRLFAFSPPGYSAGCGGIDFWGGAYGFPNAEQFVSTLRNIGQNATGYFFKIALKSLAPEIDATLESIADTMNKINSLGMNSCRESEALANTVGQAIGLSGANTAKTQGTFIGAASDFFTASNTMKTSPATVQQTLKSACTQFAYLCKDENGKIRMDYGDFNLISAAVNVNSGGLNQSELEMLMSLVGTIVFRVPENDATDVTAQYIPNVIKWDDFIGDRDGVSQIPLVYKCPDEACVFPKGGVPQKSPAANFKGFAQLSKERLTHIYEAIKNRQKLTDPNALTLMNMTSAPVYSMLSAAASAGGNPLLAQQIINLYADFVAQEMAFKYVTWIHNEFYKATQAFKTDVDTARREEIEKFTARLGEIVAEASVSHDKVQRNVAERSQSIMLVMHFQQTMNKSLGPKLMGNLNFGKKS